jgi:hypothetical protein
MENRKLLGVTLAWPGHMSVQHSMVAARTQVAVVRALVDELEQASADDNTEHWMRAQLIEELTRLGSRIMDLAASMTATAT